MLKIYKTYLQYQTDGGTWERFGYSGWLCEEESDIEASKSIIENANFKQAFEHFENFPIHDVAVCRTYFREEMESSWSNIEYLTDEELNEKTDEELEDLMLEREDGYYCVPEECCPICQFIEYSNCDLARFLEREYKVSRDEVFAKVKALNKRRKKLYDSEYVTEVCSRFNLNPAEIVSGLKDRFGTYRHFRDYINSR